MNMNYELDFLFIIIMLVHSFCAGNVVAQKLLIFFSCISFSLTATSHPHTHTHTHILILLFIYYYSFGCFCCCSVHSIVSFLLAFLLFILIIVSSKWRAREREWERDEKEKKIKEQTKKQSISSFQHKEMSCVSCWCEVLFTLYCVQYQLEKLFSLCTSCAFCCCCCRCCFSLQLLLLLMSLFLLCVCVCVYSKGGGWHSAYCNRDNYTQSINQMPHFWSGNHVWFWRASNFLFGSINISKSG